MINYKDLDMNIRQITLLLIGIGTFSLAFSMEQPNLSVRWGFSSRQGERSTMEDAYVVRKVQLQPFGKAAKYFGIFDGHGGSGAAEYAANYAASFFLFSYKDALAGKDVAIDQAVTESFIHSYDQLDKGIKDKYVSEGTTAVSALLYGDSLHVAWAGDARALVLDENGTIKLATEDHKPDKEKERARIRAAGNDIWFHGGRVARIGALAISRTLGDRKAKSLVNPGAIIPRPEVRGISVQEGDMVILACDGVWDVLNNTEVSSFIASKLPLTVDELQKEFPLVKPSQNKLGIVELVEEDCSEDLESNENNCTVSKLGLIARGLRDKAFKDGSGDNISVMIIQS